jgi:hypothetical protein
MSSTSVISRVYIGELPYIKPFIHHYKMLHFDKIYLVITKSSEKEEIKTYLRDYDDSIVYIDQTVDENVLMKNMNGLIVNIKEDYVLNVDIDEFLDLTPHNDIRVLLTEAKSEKQYFSWAITVNDGISTTSYATRGQTRRNHPWKTMCKVSCIDKWDGSHDVFTKEPIVGEISKYKLIHYWGRNFNDILIKSIYGSGLKNAKSSSLDNVKKNIYSDNLNSLPNRFKMLAVLSVCKKDIFLETDYCLKYIDIEKESELINSVITLEERDKLYKKYVEYKNKLDYERFVKEYFQKGLLGMDWDTLVV